MRFISNTLLLGLAFPFAVHPNPKGDQVHIHGIPQPLAARYALGGGSGASTWDALALSLRSKRYAMSQMYV